MKTHSQGEYVFDHSWAEAFSRAGGHYYPKLQVAVPFTPVTGDAFSSRRVAISRLHAVRSWRAFGPCARRSAPRRSTRPSRPRPNGALGAAGWLQRTDQQFHFINEGYAGFDDFLAALASRKRKSIKRERRDALGDGITIEHVTGRDITEAHWDAFFAFYMDTGSRKWGRPYLNRRFFSLVGAAMAGPHPAGDGAPRRPLYRRRDQLHRRRRALRPQLGAIEEHPFLHFEVCYYQAIDFASRGA